ncbi:substrate-binding domain-containing protein [Bremerella sp. JC770]|uniref:substrate-binding domain-containing protein n=1 Tax=Bremerella sp. JC770 TaxID=3232137 RepID=UPI0034597612
MIEKRRRIALSLDLEWPYKRHSDVYAGTQQYIHEQGWDSVIDEFVADSLPETRRGKVPYDGIIARATSRLGQRCQKLKLPLVNVFQSSPAREKLPGVFPDFHISGRSRAEHLMSRGVRNFAALGCHDDISDLLEIDALQTVITRRGHRCITEWLNLSYYGSLTQWRKTERTISKWMDQWQLPIGVSIGSDNLGRLVMQKCHERGWRIPEDVAIIAGRNEETICLRPHPSITSMEMGYEQVGYEAARLLHLLMDQKTPPTHQIYLPPVGIVIRESTDFFAVEDELIAAALSFIAENCHRRIGATDVARAVSTETRTLQNRFRKILSKPIAATIRSVRLERAKRELTQTDRPLKTIAREVGFGDPMRMYQVFRRELGVTPSDYRQQRRISATPEDSNA